MKQLLYIVFLLMLCPPGAAQESFSTTRTQEEINKEIARNFFLDLWFSNNTGNYKKYVADTYVVHDIGDRKGVTEQAVEQKNIADFFWNNGEMDCKFDYQVAEGDLVATRWTISYRPNTLFGKFFLASDEPFSIINVFRIKDGKIVEFWNHRHDIDTPQTMKFVFKGLLWGLLIALIPTFFVFRLRRKLKALRR
ncbi:ester cyclase [Flavobacteriaceae bacterium 3-367]|uniref:ester cyclase n=1 Tax=Eudoraea algarum TaxID=3417568 RepID=UPI0032744A00